MKTSKTILVVLLATLVLSSCSTDKSMTSKGVNLDKYEYASVVQARNYFGTVNDIEIEPGIYDAVEATRLQMVGERRIQDLTEEQKEKLVLVKYTATSTPEESVISISFEDYMTGKVVASCRSSNRGSWTRQRDVDKAIKKLSQRIMNIWGKTK
jgi:hypothetical protein